MNNIPKRDEFPEFENIFRISEDIMGFLPNSMLYMSYNPSLLLTFLMLSKVVLRQKSKISRLEKIKIFGKLLISIIKREKEEDTIGAELRWLIAYVASNAAGCTYCQAHTSHSAYRTGVSEQKINEAFTFKESSLFTEKEKSALSIALSGGSTPNRTTKKHFVELNKFFSKKEILEIVSIISIFGFLNRWNDTLKTPLENIFNE